MPRSDIKDLVWPRGGIVENSPESSPPDGDDVAPTTQDALNVRCFDSFDRRNRGGQRTGLAKFISTQVNGTNDLQLISGIVEAVALSEDAGFGDKYADPSTLPTTNGRAVVFHPDGDRVCTFHNTSGTSAQLITYAFSQATGFGAQIQSLTLSVASLSSSVPLRLSFNADGTYLLWVSVATSPSDTNMRVFPFNKATGCGTAVNVPISTGITNTSKWQYACWHPDGDQIFFCYNAITSNLVSVRVYGFTGSFSAVAHTISHAALTTTLPCVACSPTGAGVVVGASVRIFTWSYDRVTGFANGTDAASDQLSSPSFNPDGTVVAFSNSTGTDSVDAYTFNAVTGVGSPVNRTGSFGLVNNVEFSPNGDFVAIAGSTSPRIFVAPWTGAWGTLLPAPSTLPTGIGAAPAWSPNGQVLAIAHTTSPFITVHGFSLAAVNPSARRQRVIAVAGGNVYRSSADLTTIPLSNSGSGALIATGTVRGVEAFQKFFFCDSTASGYKYLNYANNTVTTWTPTAGALPVGTADTAIGCRIMALYRGRVVMSGLLEEPHNWFMSKSGDPFDWDYSPAATSPVQAVAGNSSTVGELGDVVTGLFPFNDDIMVMGGVNSIWLMQGDPAAGGAIDNISRQIGIVGPDAGTWDSSGNFFFLGQNGLYRLAQGSNEPILISKGKLDKSLSEINTKTHRVWLAYDALWQGLHIFVIPQSEPGTAPLQYFWDERNNSFWPDQYPTAHGPTCVHMFTADDPDQRGLLMGGFDGYIRQFQDTAKDDDGTLITSKVTFPIINPGRVFASSRIEDIWMQTDASSDPVTMSIYAGDTVEQARANQAAGTVRVRRSLVGGRNTPLRQRIAQNTLLVQLTQSGNAAAAASWAFEQGGLKVAIVNKMHGRRV